MSEYTDGYTPGTLASRVSLWDDMATPAVSVNCHMNADFGNHIAEVVAAMEAAAAAFKTSIEAAIPGQTATVSQIEVTGGKILS